MSFLILLTSSRDLITYVSFYFNQDYIANNLCENRDKPAIMCYGKCVLSDSIVENHENEENNTPISQQEDRTVFVLPQIEAKPKAPIVIYVEKESIVYKTSFYTYEYLDDIFHPPPFFS